MIMTTSATLSSEFNVTLPRELCERRSWKPGQQFALLPKAGGLLMIPVPTVDAIRGIAAGASVQDYRER
jgi:hypothetical protein